eukprot:1157512-Pelagomonas_calceolata.AAC.8
MPGVPQVGDSGSRQKSLQSPCQNEDLGLLAPGLADSQEGLGTSPGGQFGVPGRGGLTTSRFWQGGIKTHKALITLDRS